MSEGDDKKPQRQHPRYPVDWRVRLRCADWHAAHRVAAGNVSRGGLFVATSHAPLVGTRVALLVELPDATSMLLHGECVYVRPPELALREHRSPGFGLRFDDTHATDLLLLEELAKSFVSQTTPPASHEAPVVEPGAPRSPMPMAQWTPGSSAHGEDESTAALDARPLTAPAPGAPRPVASRGSGALTQLAPTHAAPTPAAAAAKEHEDEAADEQPTIARWSYGSGSAPSAPVPRLPALQPLGADREPAFEGRLGKGAPHPAAGHAAARRQSDEPIQGAAEAVGIDFGTSYTRIAVHTARGVRLLADDQGRTVFPSVISYPDSGGSIVGWQAYFELAVHPQRTIASAKRLLGRRCDHPEIQGLLASASYQTERGPNDQVVVRMGDQSIAVPQVCAAIIRQACEIGEQRLGTRIRKAVLSMPVTFGPEQQAALKRAALLAGLDVVGVIEEPVAGALTYGFGRGANDLVAVYDFGGGTFDFTVMDVSGNASRVLGTAGDSWLGGDDFDLALAQWAADRFWSNGSGC
jgi:Tfp pilus assembly protein PilZ